MLEAHLKSQLKGYLERVTQPVELVATLDDRPASVEMRELLEEIVTLSPLLSVRYDGQDTRRPSFSISRAGANMGLRFAAIPMGHEFTSLVLALLQAGGTRVHAPLLDQLALVPDGKAHIGAGQGVAAHGFNAMGQLGAVAFQKFAACRR